MNKNPAKGTTRPLTLSNNSPPGMAIQQSIVEQWNAHGADITLWKAPGVLYSEHEYLMGPYGDNATSRKNKHRTSYNKRTTEHFLLNGKFYLSCPNYCCTFFMALTKQFSHCFLSGAEKPSFTLRNRARVPGNAANAEPPAAEDTAAVDSRNFWGAGVDFAPSPADEVLADEVAEGDAEDIQSTDGKDDSNDDTSEDEAELFADPFAKKIEISHHDLDEDDDDDSVDNLSHTLSLSTISDRIELIKKESTIIVPTFCPRVATMDGCKVATASVFLPEQFSTVFHSHIEEGGRKVVISFPRNESNYEEFFLSTVEATGVLKEVWSGFVLEQRQIAVANGHEWGAEKMAFRIPFKAKEEFHKGLFPATEDVGIDGIGCSNMQNTDGTSNGIVLTFGVIERPSLAHKIKSPNARMPRIKKVRDMQHSAKQASQAAYNNEAQRQQIERHNQQIELQNAAMLRAQEALEQCERELAFRAAELLKNEQQAAGRVSGNVRQHAEMNDVGNVDMVEQENDDLDDLTGF